MTNTHTADVEAESSSTPTNTKSTTFSSRNTSENTITIAENISSTTHTAINTEEISEFPTTKKNTSRPRTLSKRPRTTKQNITQDNTQNDILNTTEVVHPKRTTRAKNKTIVPHTQSSTALSIAESQATQEEQNQQDIILAKTPPQKSAKPRRTLRNKKIVPVSTPSTLSTQESEQTILPMHTHEQETGQVLHATIEQTQENSLHTSELQEISTQQEQASEVFMSTQENTVSSTAQPTIEENISSTEENPPAKSRTQGRGRRGGKGRRAKRQTADTETVILQDDNEINITKGLQGTSLAVGKPGKVQQAKTALREKTDEESVKAKKRKMFISMVPGEQVEVALVEEGDIHEYYLEMLHQVKTKGNIYKGIVNNIDNNLQAAFVNYGAAKNGFLQIDEIHPEYYQSHQELTKGQKFPPIQQVIKQGQEVLVQVVKEPTGNKGAFLTTWLSLAGRFLVLTPGQEQIGVSRKVDDDEERTRLRDMMTGIEPGTGLGVIVRTVSAGTSKTTLKNDLQYLKRVWRGIRKRGTEEIAPVAIYQEPHLAERAIRDYLSDDVCEVWVDNTTVAETLRETVALLFPRKKDLIRIHADVKQTLWERFNIQRQLEQIYSREVHLPSGGRLVFDQTEALMAIDINSGKISGKGNFASMALKTNMEAAETIARHLKLRDIGGQVVIDFIEMRDKNHVRQVEKALRNAMKSDRARYDVARISPFGLLEIVRQRTGSSALAVTMEPCPVCGGTGTRRNLEWQALQALRHIARQGRTTTIGTCVFETSAELGMYLLNHKRDGLRALEEQMQLAIEIRIRP